VTANDLWLGLAIIAALVAVFGVIVGIVNGWESDDRSGE
jgi:hypothetical protein